MIEINTEALTTEQVRLPRTQTCIAKARAFFNSEAFYEQYREPLAFHEAGHAVYAVRASATNLKFNPPAVRWNEKRNAPSVMWAHVSFTLPEAETDLIARLKMWKAGMVVQGKLAPSPVFEAFKSPVLTDTALAKSDYLASGGKEDDFEGDWATAEAQISGDLDNLAFCETFRILASAFVEQSFPLAELKAIREVARLTEVLRKTRDARVLLAS